MSPPRIREGKRQVREKVVSALTDLIERDGMLLQNDVNERAITHKLGSYVQMRFRRWNVDCEYNRNHDDAKRLNLNPGRVMTNDTQGQTVFPDVIVHKRNTNANLLVIEVKKSTNPNDDDHDVQKLRAFKSQLGYSYAVFVRLATGQGTGRRPFTLRWI
jgi:hypothetical protein